MVTTLVFIVTTIVFIVTRMMKYMDCVVLLSTVAKITCIIVYKVLVHQNLRMYGNKVHRNYNYF